MSKFKVGDEVLLVEQAGSWEPGRTGTVALVYKDDSSYDYGVKMDGTVMSMPVAIYEHEIELLEDPNDADDILISREAWKVATDFLGEDAKALTLLRLAEYLTKFKEEEDKNV